MPAGATWSTVFSNWTGGCPLTEVVIGARNDEGMCTYGDCSNDRFRQCRRGANECGPTPARDDGYYAERLPNGSGVDGPATSSALSLGMYDTCRYLLDTTMVDGNSETCELPTLRAPNGFEQRTGIALRGVDRATLAIGANVSSGGCAPPVLLFSPLSPAKAKALSTLGWARTTCSASSTSAFFCSIDRLPRALT